MLIKNVWFMAAATAEITVGVGSGSALGLFGYMSPELASLSGVSPFGSISNPELIYAIMWGDETSEIETVYSRVNNKIFTFPTFTSNLFNTSEFSDISSSAPTIAPVYANNFTYYMGSVLPTTPGATIPYIVS